MTRGQQRHSTHACPHEGARVHQINQAKLKTKTPFKPKFITDLRKIKSQMVAKTIVDYNNYVSHGFVAENEEPIMSS